MTRFRHFLVTRFNLSEAGWPQDGQRPPPVIGDDWMARRIPLFRDFCLHSVAAQSEKAFEWLIYLDTQTPSRFRDELAGLVAHHPWIRLLYIDGMPAFLPSLRAHLAEHTRDCTHVITSRVDNDDCLHRDYIAAVQREFAGQRCQAIDFPHGYSLQVQPPVRLGLNDQLSNPFISLIEENQAPLTVWAKSHAHWKKTTSPQKYRIAGDGRRLWLAVIHAQNKANLFTGYGRVDWAAVRDDFPIAPDVSARIGAAQQPCTQWRWRNLRNRCKLKLGWAGTALKRKLGRYPA